MRIKVQEKTLSDSSKVYNVELACGQQRITVEAISADDAGQFALAVRQAVEEHTNDYVAIEGL